ncbi:MAG TPA: LysE family translocator [Steroidobacteraceae bacterium]|nr:LysE family translocator [Steroidobacteraceae bacterium]
MRLEVWLAFVAASSVLLVIPGPTILTVISYSTAHGRRALVPLVAGVALGDSSALAISLLGLGALLARAAVLFTAVKVLGGLYLLYLGLTLLRTRVPRQERSPPPAPRSARRLFANTWLVTALNPKGIVFFVAFLPQFIDPHLAIAPQVWLLALTFVALAIVNAALYAFFGASVRGALDSARAQRAFSVLGGSLLCGAGVWALLARRPA